MFLYWTNVTQNKTLHLFFFLIQKFHRRWPQKSSSWTGEKAEIQKATDGIYPYRRTPLQCKQERCKKKWVQIWPSQCEALPTGGFCQVTRGKWERRGRGMSEIWWEKSRYDWWIQRIQSFVSQCWVLLWCLRSWKPVSPILWFFTSNLCCLGASSEKVCSNKI